MEKSPEIEAQCGTCTSEVSSATESSPEPRSLDVWGKVVAIRGAILCHHVASHCKLMQTCRTRLAQLLAWDCIVTSGLV